MANVFDVAKYILNKQSPMTAMKLQKLVYYSQAWSLVWDETSLFKNRIEAWANGPVAPTLYNRHRGKFMVQKRDISGSLNALNSDQRETIDAVLKHYGHRSSQWLSKLTHSEPPWKDARTGLFPGERGHQEITLSAMAEYYGSL